MSLPEIIDSYLRRAAETLVNRALLKDNEDLKRKIRALETDLKQSRSHVAAVRSIVARERIELRRERTAWELRRRPA